MSCKRYEVIRRCLIAVHENGSERAHCKYLKVFGGRVTKTFELVRLASGSHLSAVVSVDGSVSCCATKLRVADVVK